MNKVLNVSDAEHSRIANAIELTRQETKRDELEIEVDSSLFVYKGDLIFKDTRTSVAHVGRKFRDKKDLSAVRDEYPLLCNADIIFAKNYVNLLERTT